MSQISFLTPVLFIQSVASWNPPEKEHIIRVEAINNTALFLQGEHADMKLSAAEEIQDELDDLYFLDVNRLLCCHGVQFC